MSNQATNFAHTRQSSSSTATPVADLPKKKKQSRTPEENRVYMKAYYQANKHKWAKRTPERQAIYNTKRREQYKCDLALRKKAREQVKDWQKKNPHKRFAQRLKVHGITPEDYHRLLERQGGRCAICGRKSSGDRRSNRLFVDHCHASGKVRGLLCTNCNTGVGQFSDRPDLLESAANYLRSHQQTCNPIQRNLFPVTEGE